MTLSARLAFHHASCEASWPSPPGPVTRARRGARGLRLGRLAGLALLAVLCVVVRPGPVRAQARTGNELVLSAPSVWGFAESLYGSGEYYRAVSEYKRLLHFFPQSPEARKAGVRIGQAYLRGGQPGQAILQFSTLLQQPRMASLRPDLLYLRGLSRLELEPGTPYRLREPHIERALKDLRAIPPGWAGSRPVRGFLAAMEHPRDVPAKSPWLAAGLSAVVPGAGSAYVGNYAEGALAFVFNALFITASVQAFHRHNDGLGVVLSVGALAFYGGAIYAAANGAQRFNDRQRAAYLSTQRTRFGIVPGPGAVSAALQVPF